MRSFDRDEKLGKEAVAAFVQYLDNQGAHYMPATQTQQWQGMDIIVGSETYEVKHQSFENAVVVEESSLTNGTGWIYSSKAKWLLEVSADRKKAWKIDMVQLRKFYDATKKNYEHYQNEKSDGTRGDQWISSFRVYPLKDFANYVDFTEVIL